MSKRSKKRLKTGIVGSGFAATFHFEAVKKLTNVDAEITGVYSETREHREKFAEARNIKTFSSLDELISNSDVIHICTPVYTHEDITIKVLEQDRYPIVEKPLTGFTGDGTEKFRGDTFSKEKARDGVQESIERILNAEKKSKANILYAENWVYTPSVQKEREIIEKSEAQILWMHGEEAHSGSHARTYGYWKYSGGGVMLGKGCHPLTAALYLKRKEGIARLGKPIQPKTVSARIHSITRMDTFQNKGHIRSDYYDIDDFSLMHVEFEDGTIADIFASDIILGGIHNWIEVAANNHRTVCNINPNNVMQTFSPREQYLQDVYIVEKLETKQGWSYPAPDEDFITGYPQEMASFYQSVAYDLPCESDSCLGADAISTIFSAYVSAEQNGKEVKIQTY